MNSKQGGHGEQARPRCIGGSRAATFTARVSALPSSAKLSRSCLGWSLLMAAKQISQWLWRWNSCGEAGVQDAKLRLGSFAWKLTHMTMVCCCHQPQVETVPDTCYCKTAIELVGCNTSSALACLHYVSLSSCIRCEMEDRLRINV
ncbi:hypothetical protein HaLaN_20608 [Haematococcus lacustris]|uniref:Uncharacterized protein n=1 Tax=Haematococcus lacustris TaxID=44745 RepID=A0A699ZWE4_HAELA|nr:hypothetical protein HaLaN_20608 [Haematococcus lacustris]